MSGNSPPRSFPPPDRPDRPDYPSNEEERELFGGLEHFHRYINRAAERDRDRDALPAEVHPAVALHMSSGSYHRELRRRFSREPQAANEPQTLPGISSLTSATGPPLPPLRSLTSSLSSRRIPTMSSWSRRPDSSSWSGRHGRYRLYHERDADLQDSNQDGPDADFGFGNLDRTVEYTSSTLRTLLDATLNSQTRPLPTPMATQADAVDHAEESRRAKRRKLDADRLAPSFKGFRYGHYGQSEPGRLAMEIVSCDGGLYSNESSYAAENILKDDNSVYCTKGNRCNIVLRHQGATVFNLKELIIKAPDSHYSSPVREGMVFISMNSDELFTRTARYQIQYLAAPRISGSRPRISGGRDVERDSERLPPIYTIREDDDGTTRVVRRQRRYSYALDDDESYRMAHVPSEFAVSPPPFRITTECSDDESEPESVVLDRRNMQDVYRPTPPRIGSLAFENGSEDDGSEGSGDELDYSTLPTPVRVAMYSQRWRRTNANANASGSGSGNASGNASGSGSGNGNGTNAVTLAEAAEASQLATQEAVRAVGGEMMAPHAKFFIEKGKSKCTIRFDPPVSGRFVLLKIWNPRQKPATNIDIQAVVANGYAGPRFLPAVEML